MSKFEKTFSCYGRDVPIGSTKEQIKEWATEIAYEKKMETEQVEEKLLGLQLEASMNHNRQKERSHTFVG